MEKLTSGKLAKAAGVNTETLRYYEREGILDPPERTSSGYRIYDENAADRLRFVHQAQALGFTIREIKDLIHLDNNLDADCDDLRLQAIEKLASVDRKIAELQRMRTGLATLLVSCEAGQPLRNCPVMKCLMECSDATHS